MKTPVKSFWRRAIGDWTPAARVPRRNARQLELLENRVLLSIDIVFDYSYDTNGFFNDATRKTAVEAASRLFEDAVTDDLAAISPSGVNSWSAQFRNPQTGVSTDIENLVVPANQIIVYLGARSLAGDQIGEASAGYSASGTSGWLDTVALRGESGANETGPWGGSIAFDTDSTWHSGVTTTGLDSGEADLFSTAIHEIGHLLGFASNNDSWVNQITAGLFEGPNALAVHGGTGIPVDGGHLLDGLMSEGQEVAMSPGGFLGNRYTFTTYDWAVLDDLGWTLNFDESDSPESGHILVQLVDAHGDPVANQSVYLSGTGTADSPSGTTDAYGLFSSFVTPGTWTVTSGSATTSVSIDGLSKEVQLTPGVPRDDVFVWDATNSRWRFGKSDGGKFTNQFGPSFNGSVDWTIVEGDFNGDGRLDFAGLGGDATTLYWYVGLANGNSNGFSVTYWGRWGATYDWRDFQVGDFNGDGRDDVAARTSNGYWWVAQSTGTSFNNVFYIPWAANGWTSVVSGDFNNDGLTDLAGRQSTGFWWFSFSLGNSFTRTSYAAYWNAGTDWRDIVAGDFNGDGFDDIAGRTDGGYWYVATSNGATLSTTLWGRWGEAAGWNDVLVGDYNGDGKADIAGRSDAGDWYIQRSSSGAFTNEYWAHWNASSTWLAAVGDFNGDGRDDLAGLMVGQGYWYVAVAQASNRFQNTYFGNWGTSLGTLKAHAAGEIG